MTSKNRFLRTIATDDNARRDLVETLAVAADLLSGGHRIHPDVAARVSHVIGHNLSEIADAIADDSIVDG